MLPKSAEQSHRWYPPIGGGYLRLQSMWWSVVRDAVGKYSFRTLSSEARSRTVLQIKSGKSVSPTANSKTRPWAPSVKKI